ncbi:MAG: hypothetical protein Q8920_05605 [Bacillota bacterium]|nr:hypothetical protein [Bacillota bacterium]
MDFVSYEEFILTIVNSEKEEWLYDDDLGRYVFRNDIRITIISDRGENEDRDFFENWATQFPDQHAFRARFFLCFNGSIIEAFYSAAVDGYRALIPYPRITDLTITNNQYRIGRIINIPYTVVIDRYDEYLSQAGIRII